MSPLMRFIDDEAGATTIEYSLFAALISMAILSAFSRMDGSLKATFQRIGDAFPE